MEESDEFPCSATFHEDKIRNAFLVLFISLFKNYRKYLVMPTNSEMKDSETTEDFFRKDAFTADSESDTRIFLKQVVYSQAFSQFILKRTGESEDDYEVLFFDESIKSKLNRSKLRFTKEATPFLNETSYQISRTIECIPPKVITGILFCNM